MRAASPCGSRPGRRNSFTPLVPIAKHEQAEKIQRITFLLGRVRDVLGSDTVVSKAVPFKVTPKGEKQARQYQTVLNYTEPDLETLQLLEQRHEQWFKDPQQFWKPIESFTYTGPSPEAQIVDRYVSLRRCDA